MTTPAMALLYCVFPITWIISGLLVAAVTSGWVKGKTAMERLPKNILIILFWPLWVIHIINTK